MLGGVSLSSLALKHVSRHGGQPRSLDWSGLCTRHARPAPVLSVFPAGTFLPVHRGEVVIFLGAHRRPVCVTGLGDALLAASAPTHTCPSVAVRGRACATGSVCWWKSAACSLSCGLDHCACERAFCPAPGLTALSRVGWSVGAGQTKGLLRGPEHGGLPARKGLLLLQRKMHDFVPEEMSHLHSGAGDVWKHRGV